MPIPKKRSTLNTSKEDAKEAKDAPAGNKVKATKSNDKGQESKPEIEEPVAESPTKTVNAPKSSKRGRGRSRK